MKFLFASDSFKGTISSARAAELLAQSAKNVFPNVETKGISVGDGGEGTVEAIVETLKGHMEEVEVTGPLGEKRKAFYAVTDRGAIIEMAAASGLPLVPVEKRNPLYTTTYGTGEMVLHALENGHRKIYLGIGGSATNDGGIGAMKALGVKFLDADGKELEGYGQDLEKIVTIETDGMNPLIKEAEFTVMCDVKNPLLGEQGATRIFGPQKGAHGEILERLEAGMENYASVVERTINKEVKSFPGAGAAGGLGAALYGFLGARMQSGINAVLELIGFDEMLADTDLVVTGEGMTDYQSAFGKTISGIAAFCKRRNVPVVVLSGGIGQGTENLYELGISSMMSTVCRPMELSEACENAEELFLEAADRMFRMIQVGMKI